MMFPRRSRRGLIEAQDCAHQGRSVRSCFRGEVAAASLKRIQCPPDYGSVAGFRGEVAAASLKPGSAQPGR